MPAECTQSDQFRGARIHLCDLSGLEIRECDVTGLKIVDCYGGNVSLGGGFERVVVNDVDVTAIDRDVTTHDAEDDVILAGDVCYERAMAEAVWPWLQAQARRGIAVLLADPGRAYAPATGLVELARYRVPTSLELEDRIERETVVYRVAG